MLRSPYWVGHAAERTTLLLLAFGTLLLFTDLWVLGLVALAVAPVALVGWLSVFRRAERQGKVAKAEEAFDRDWAWLREAGPLKKAGAIVVLALALAAMVVLLYLRWQWRATS